MAHATLGRACPKAKNSPKIYALSSACLIFNFPQPASVTDLMALSPLYWAANGIEPDDDISDTSVVQQLPQ